MTPSNQVQEVSFENAQQLLVDNSFQKPVVIEFYTPSDPQSLQFQQLLAQLHQTFDFQFNLCRLNVQTCGQIASQLGINQAPAIVILKNGQPVDGSIEVNNPQQIKMMIAQQLPAEEDIALANARQLLEAGDHVNALAAAKQAYEIAASRSDIKLVYIQTLINNQQAELAKQLLDSLPLEDQQADFHALTSQLQLLLAAAESPEIQTLEQQLQEQPDNLQVKHELAIQYSQAQRHEEALELLFPLLQSNLEILDGQVKKTFLDLLVTLNGQAIASSYRRKYYSLLY